MSTQNEYFGALRNFVPVGFAHSAKDFLYYLRTLNEKRYNIREYSIEVSSTGLEVFIYRPQYTPTQYFSWNELKKLIDKEFGVGFNIGEQTAMFGSIEIQLKNSF
jgi:hypothetical protein